MYIFQTYIFKNITFMVFFQPTCIQISDKMTQRSAETPLRVLRKSCADTSSSSAPRCRESDAFMKSGLLRSKCVTSSNPAFTTTAIIIIIKIYHYNSLLNFHAELHEGLGTKKKYDATLMSL